jgi:hypothetical protein
MIKTKYLPQNRGFDTAFGYYEGAIDYYTHTVGPFLDLHEAVAGGEQQCLPQLNGTYDMVLFGEKANALLDAHLEEHTGANGSLVAPLFLYLALHSVHEPDECPKNWTDLYPHVSTADNRRTMCGMVSAMDSVVGDVVSQWQSKMGRNWIMLFHSDNGGPTYPLAGTSVGMPHCFITPTHTALPQHTLFSLLPAPTHAPPPLSSEYFTSTPSPHPTAATLSSRRHYFPKQAPKTGHFEEAS